MSVNVQNIRHQYYLLVSAFVLAFFFTSLNAVAQISNEDKQEIDQLINRSQVEFDNHNYSKAIMLGERAKDKSSQLGYVKGVIKSAVLIADSYKFTTVFSKALNNYLQALSEIQKTNVKEDLRSINMKLGTLFYEWGVPEKAIGYYQEALNITLNVSNDAQISLLKQIAETNLRLDKYEEALAYFRKVLLLQQEDNSKEVINTLSRIAGIYNQVSDYDSALKYNLEVLKLNQQAKDSVKIAASLNTIGSLYKDLDNLPKALEYYEAALELNKKMKPTIRNENSAISNLINIGVINQSLGKYRLSVKNFSEALNIKRESGTSVEIAVMHNYLASINFSLRKYGDAKELTLAAINLLENTNNKRMLATNYKRLSDIYQMMGDYRLALKSYEQYSHLKDSILYRDQLVQEREIYKQYVIGTTEKESKLNTIDQEMRALELSNERVIAEQEKQGMELELRAKELQNITLKNKQLEAEKELQAMRLMQEQSEIQKQGQEIILLEQKRDLQETELEKNMLLDKEQFKEIELQKTNIELQKTALEASDSRQSFLVGMSLLFFIIFVLILLGYMLKQRDNEKLKGKNIEISNQKETIEEVNEELVKLNEEKNDLIGVVAHDIKSPLNQIMGFLTILRISSDKQEDYLSQIEQSAQGLKNMVNKILDINSIETKTSNIQTEDINLKDILQATIKGFEELAKRKGISIKMEMDKTVSNAKLDTDFVRKVYTNILSNAIKYSPLNKTVTVRLHEAGDWIRAEFIDQGQGINKEDMKNLFSKYHKLSAKPTAGEDSTGLGLSIVKKYVDVLHGKVWCECDEGEGANFIVEFKKSDIG